MQPGEVLVARLAKGAALVRYLGQTESRVTVALNRNRQARVPHDRVILKTGLISSDEEEFEQFRRRCQALSSDVDLSEVWEVVVDEASSFSADGLSELYWDISPDAVHRAALSVHLEDATDYFERKKDGYVPRPRKSVDEIRARRIRELENATQAASLMRDLSHGRVPEPLSGYQSGLIENLSSYAVHGEDFPRSGAARSFLETVPGPGTDLPRQAFDLLVAAGIFGPDEPIELRRAGISDRFPDEALAEAEEIDLAAMLADPRRRDLTAVPTVTIDDARTKDRDDAVSLEVTEAASGGPADRFLVGIHIADAGALVPIGGAIDREAGQRMTTLYVPDGGIPMLPPTFALRAASLDAGQKRASLSLLVQISGSGEVLSWEVSPAVVRVDATLTYDETEEAIQDQSSPWHEMLGHLFRVAQALRRSREAAGAINVDPPEMDIDVRPSGEVEVTVRQRSTTARVLVSELMILCNSLLADFCRRRGLPAAYRSQRAPAEASTTAETGSQTPRSEAEAVLWRFRAMRRLQPAELDIIPAPHSSLGVPAYIQATSPLRRYPDLVMQRQIGHFLNSGQSLYTAEQVESLVQRVEVELREMARLEEERNRYWFLKHLKESRLEKRGSDDDPQLFGAVVLENQPRRKALVELVEYPFRVRADLPQTCEPGETLTLKLVGVDLWRRAAHFVHEAR